MNRIYIHTHTHTVTHMYMHTLEFYLALKRKDILKYIIAWIYFEYIMLNELSQSQEDKYCMITFI